MIFKSPFLEEFSGRENPPACRNIYSQSFLKMVPFLCFFYYYFRLDEIYEKHHLLLGVECHSHSEKEETFYYPFKTIKLAEKTFEVFCIYRNVTKEVMTSMDV